MIDDQLTLYIDEIAYDSILNDQKLFNSNGNISSFIKAIIINHYPTFQKESNNLKKVIEASIKKQEIETSSNNIAWDIIKYISNQSIKSKSTNKNSKKKVHIRKNKKNKKDSQLDFILESRPLDASSSEYLASIIYSYLELPQYEREKIIYKDIVDILELAIKNNQGVKIKTHSYRNNSDMIRSIDPYELCTSKEEIYNYLLFQGESNHGKYPSNIHLYNILDISIEARGRDFDLKVLNTFERMKRNGVQFSLNSDTVYKVRLSEDGILKYNLRYLERPAYTSKVDNLYTFDCSEMQFINYFAPFYYDIIILEPEDMISKLKDKLKQTLECYEGNE